MFQRLLAIGWYLAPYNLAFRGHEDKMESHFSDNFSDLGKFIARFGLTLRDHLGKVEDKNRDYLVKYMQNELMQRLLGSDLKF